MKTYNIIYIGTSWGEIVATVKARNECEALEKAGYDWDDHLAEEIVREIRHHYDEEEQMRLNN